MEHNYCCGEYLFKPENLIEERDKGSLNDWYFSIRVYKCPMCQKLFMVDYEIDDHGEHFREV